MRISTVCEAAKNSYRVVNSRFTRSGSPEPLTELIALYVLTGGPLKALVEALHPEPNKADLDKIEGLAYGRGLENGLRLRAEQLDSEIRGKSVKPGRLPAEVSPEEQMATFWMDIYLRSGLTDAEIAQKLENFGFHFGEHKVSRIRNLRLAIPSTDDAFF